MQNGILNCHFTIKSTKKYTISTVLKVAADCGRLRLTFHFMHVYCISEVHINNLTEFNGDIPRIKETR